LTKRVIALAWAVDPLAFSDFFPPQLTFAEGVEVDAPPPLAFLSLPHADKISAPVVRMLSAAPNRSSFNLVPLVDGPAMIAAGRNDVIKVAGGRFKHNCNFGG
jgi:hypothetical protein